MKPEELAQRCVDSLNFILSCNLPMSNAGITVTTPKGWKAPPKFPRGEILQRKKDGTTIRRFSAIKAFSWLAKNGLVNVVFEDQK